MMKKTYVRGIVPLLGLIVPFIALGIVLRKGWNPVGFRSIGERDYLNYY